MPANFAYELPNCATELHFRVSDDLKRLISLTREKQLLPLHEKAGHAHFLLGRTL